MTARYPNLKSVELLLLVCGVALMLTAAFLYLGGRLQSRGALARFHSAPAWQRVAAQPGLEDTRNVNYSLWSRQRVEQYKARLAEHFDEPLAVLRVDKLHLEVPVFEGTNDRVLNRGVGRIGGTARIGESGNVGIAGHRDGFFRGLKNIRVGDSMKLETSSGIQTYRIDSIRVVNRDDVGVLKSRSSSELTLVTCFPFYFVGSAPQRYIVHGSLTGEIKTPNKSAKASSKATASRSKENTQ